MRHVVAGVDLSLTGLALVAVPSDWGHNFARIQRVTLQTNPAYGSVTQRMRDMACDAAAWLEWACARKVYLEEPIVTRKQHNLGQVFRLGGMLELEVLDLTGESRCEWASLIKSRQMFCGSVSKAVVEATVDALTDLFEDEHQKHAFVAANWGLHELGYTALTARAA